jgi:hypothetical protein
MSYAESPTETLIKFDTNPAWRTSPIKVLTADFLSINCESNLFLNPAYYEEKNGRLWDPVRETTVAGSAIKADETEENVIGQIEKWFLSHESGLAVHISPRKKTTPKHPGYPEEQITIYRISYKLTVDSGLTRQKVLFYTSHQFKANFRNPEEIRKFIFTEDDYEESIFEIMNWLKNISQKPVQTEIHDLEKRRRQAEYYAYQYRSGVPIERIIYEMDQTKFLGKNPIGCGAPNIISRNLSFTITSTIKFGFEDQYGCLEFTCPKCGAINTRPVGRLLSNCQHCGASVRC